MPSILLIVSGSIAAIKVPDLLRQLKQRDISVHCVLTEAGAKFVKEEELASLTGHHVYRDLFSKTDEDGMEHIRLSRDADLVVVAPASADLIAKMANGYANDLASTTLLAANKKILVAPAMNTQMWNHPATQRNLAQITADGASIIPPGVGLLACGEVGPGRMAEPEIIVEHIVSALRTPHPALGALRALVTSGPTHEPIDPVRYIANHSSGKQGHAIATALARAGVQVTLVTGPTNLSDPSGVTVKHVMSAEDMLKACEAALPVDIAVCAAAVADWRVSKPSAMKLKKINVGAVPELHLIENPDILAAISTHAKRPKLVIGFAAETDNVLDNAAKKLKTKGCDWILANDVSAGKAFGVDENQVTLLTRKEQEQWPLLSKQAIAEKLTAKILNAVIPAQAGISCGNDKDCEK